MVDKTPLVEFLKVEQGWEKRTTQAFAQASKDIDAEIMKLKPKTNVSSGLRIEQLNASKKAINEKLGELYEDLGDSITAAQYKAVAAAVPVSHKETIAYIEKHGADVGLLVDSLTEKATNNVHAAMKRMQGTSYVPLSKSVYKNEALTKGVVDGIVNSGLANGLSAREIADRVKMHIDPSTPGGASYAAMRLGRTEINNAYHATQVEEAVNSPWVETVDWNTSGSHKNEDDCDHYRELSPWNKNEVPRKPHPQCFCFITPNVMGEDDFLDTLFAEKEGKAVDHEMFSGNEALERWVQRTKEAVKPVKQIPPIFNSYTTAMDWLKSVATYDGLSSKGKLSSMLAAHQKGNTASLRKHAKDAKGDVKEAFEGITGVKLTDPPQKDLPYPPPKPETKANAPFPKPKDSDLKTFESASNWVKKQPEFFDAPYNAKADFASALVAHKKGFHASAAKYASDLPESMKNAFEELTGSSVASLKKKTVPKKTVASPATKAPAKKTTKKAPAFPKVPKNFPDGSAKIWVMKKPVLANLSDPDSLAKLLSMHKDGYVNSLQSLVKEVNEDVLDAFVQMTGSKVAKDYIAKGGPNTGMAAASLAGKVYDAPAVKAPVKKPAAKAPAPPPPPKPKPKPKLTPAQEKWKGKPQPVKPTVDPDLKLPEASAPIPAGLMDNIGDLLDKSSPMHGTTLSLMKNMTGSNLNAAKAFVEAAHSMGVMSGANLTKALSDIVDLEKKAAKKPDPKLVAAIKAQDEALEKWDKDFADWSVANGADDFGMDSAKRYESEREALDWAHKNLPVARGRQKAAVKDYTGSMYDPWNAALRSMSERRGDPGGRWSEATANVDAAMKPIPQRTIVHRGSKPDAFVLNGRRLDAFSTTAEEMQGLIGSVQVDQGYMSTSVGTRAAFADKYVQLKIVVPEGHGVAWAKPYSKFPHENELVLQRGSRLFFHDVYKDERTGKWVVEAEVIPEGVSEEEFAARGRRPSQKRFTL